ncbi:hypothetical protein RhiirA4_549915 [Rhizophagus irregularis]|uniref:Uncharacterized protein n=1 Tax=Rhizophagus irregularis TaxID=588596 RepID=A0A2I1HGN6_9GLOM|nr:hypothetical protein RhiirA4_549915 [Rhizophagus irregularis]
MCLWKGEGIAIDSHEALKYLKMAANQRNFTAMYIIGKAYWNGGNDIEQNKIQGAEYLKIAANNDHPTAKKMLFTELHDWQNITRIYGLTCGRDKWYLVSEWAEYAVEIVHRDIRAENILINETAKQANFNLAVNYSRIAASLKQSQKLERLLWEIAEKRTPYEQYVGILKITDIVHNKQ